MQKPGGWWHITNLVLKKITHLISQIILVGLKKITNYKESKEIHRRKGGYSFNLSKIWLHC